MKKFGNVKNILYISFVSSLTFWYHRAVKLTP